ncbi:divergent polysaccharide deacetylase family protein [Hyphomonas sp. BRH_c22]|uniref:divergent polysaccharide deacetylase family protein n=1 Tax=Hyphomonas sp. BRH_c22 TaxID=1629710 RepID=UPI000B30F5E4|nr:divergent polysaccharide deacetylase family protein [Hyphomonas sp. BRH_c22]
MPYRRDAEPSPLRTGIVHAGLSLLVFGGLAGALGAGIQFSGDPSAAGPRQQLALFEVVDDARPTLKTRLKTEGADQAMIATLGDDGYPEVESGDEPSLGVDYADAPGVTGTGGPSDDAVADAAGVGVRINGKLVKPGESYGEVTAIVSLDTAPISGMSETVNGVRLPRIAPDGRAPADAYARPFANPGQQPVVSLVVGGLGINATHTKSAIEELPPEVTLSFAPDAQRLQYWIDRARASGHEVLIELPMENFDYGRMKMHPQTLLAGKDASVNVARLNTLLGRASGYFGVINYQGSKFSGDAEAVRPVLQALSDRGVALVEDGSLEEASFDTVADATRVRYVKASAPIDTKLTADDINLQLLELETRAKATGAAMGAGYAFPITIEMAKIWTSELGQKGILLAPVSALVGTTPAEFVNDDRNGTGSTAKAPVNPAG